MNSSEDPSIPPATPPPTLQQAKRRRAIITGAFLVGLVPWALALPTNIANNSILFLIFASLALPPIAVVLAIFRRTRPIALGLLLSSGLGWLVLACICGGLFRSR